MLTSVSYLFFKSRNSALRASTSLFPLDGVEDSIGDGDAVDVGIALGRAGEVAGD